MSQFDMGKKVFFIYPPVDFAKNTLRKLFEKGFEIYKINSTEKLIPLLESFPDAVLFLNTDYPYEDFDLKSFNDTILPAHKGVQAYTFFNESVTFGDQFKDYISLNQSEDELLEQLVTILDENGSHGKREYVRFGSYSRKLCDFSFECEGMTLEGSLHDISPRALSFSCHTNLEEYLTSPVKDMELSVGAYSIKVSGILEQKREFAGNPLYISVFDGVEYEEELFNFVFTSLEKEMDELIQNL